MRLPHVLPLLVGTSLLFACTPQEVDEAPDLAVIEGQLREFEAAYAAAIVVGDVDDLLEFYSPDLVSLPPNEPMRRGREWVRGVIDMYYRDFEFQEEFRIVDFKPLADRLAVTLEYRAWGTIKADGTAFEEVGKGLAILNRAADGRWQFEWNSWSPSAPSEATS